MSCGDRYGGGQGYVDICGQLPAYHKNTIGLCDKCKDKLILKLVKLVDMDELDVDEYQYAVNLISKEKSDE